MKITGTEKEEKKKKIRMRRKREEYRLGHGLPSSYLRGKRGIFASPGSTVLSQPL